MINNRIQNTFKNLKKNKKKALITFVTGCDPNYKTSQKILNELSKQAADLLEIGMPFSDPMADGPTIQLSSNRAIKRGVNLKTIFEICSYLRKVNKKIPIILMGYYNVILHYGLNSFVKECSSIGIDGLIIVDLQPEEDSELYGLIESKNISLIRLITPTNLPL